MRILGAIALGLVLALGISAGVLYFESSLVFIAGGGLIVTLLVIFNRLKRPALALAATIPMFVVVLLGPVTLSTTKSARIGYIGTESFNRRNAQNLASMFGHAQQADIDFRRDSLEATIAAVVKGARVENAFSAFDGSYYGVPHLSEEDQKAAAKHLKLENGFLVYNPDHEP
ncbi:MAG: hypothetical protein AAF585_01400 [Verrucomicrobiota bacterium]